MDDISKEREKKEITTIFKDGDLSRLTGKDDEGDDDEEEEQEEPKEEEEDAKEEEEEEVEEKPKRGAKKAPKRKKDSDDSEEGSDAQEKESDEVYSPPKKKAKAKPAKGKAAKGRKKKGSDSDEDWGKCKKGGAKKGGGGGILKACTLSPELAAIVGAERMARHEVVKKIWGIIKEKKLYDPKNKQYAICNDELLKVMGTKRFRIFGMMKYLEKHFVD